MTVEEMVARKMMTSKEIKSCTIKVKELADLRFVLEVVQETLSDKIVWVILDAAYVEGILFEAESLYNNVKAFWLGVVKIQIKETNIVSAETFWGEKVFELKKGQPEIIIFVEKGDSR